MHLESVAGFFAFSRNKILLHALSESFRGKGLAKYFWSAACEKLFSQGFSELISSISASNLAVLNLYASLGFRFRKPLDVYHWLFEE
jgi:ribosomal protein S18 acetylase RimI-like enzyme